MTAVWAKTPCVIVPCASPATQVLGYTCTGGHDETARVCERDAYRLMRGQDAPGQPCPTPGCDLPAWFIIWCGMCRRGAHNDCRALNVVNWATGEPDITRAEQYCACSCDTSLPLVAGAGYARDLDYAIDEEAP